MSTPSPRSPARALVRLAGTVLALVFLAVSLTCGRGREAHSPEQPSVAADPISCVMDNDCPGQPPPPCGRLTGRCVNRVCEVESTCGADKVCSAKGCCVSKVACPCGERDCSDRCTSPANLGAACGCGGQIGCDGKCSKPGPANLGRACNCGGTIQCDGRCSKAACPAGTSCSGGSCCASGACGCGGSRRCDGSCTKPDCGAGQACVNGSCCSASVGQSCDCGGTIQCSGHCAFACPEPTTLCSNRQCVCPDGNPACGGDCCPSGTTCRVGGVCKSDSEMCHEAFMICGANCRGNQCCLTTCEEHFCVCNGGTHCMSQCDAESIEKAERHLEQARKERAAADSVEKRKASPRHK